MPKFFLILPVFLFLLSCGYSNEVDPCNTANGKFIYGKHYISSDLLTEEGKWKFNSWLKLYKKEKGNWPEYRCIPIEKPQTIEEKIKEHDSYADLLK